MSQIRTLPRALAPLVVVILSVGAGCGSSSRPRALAPHARAVLDRHIAEARQAMSFGDQAGAQQALAAISDDIQVLGARHAADASQLALLRLETEHALARVVLDVHAKIPQPGAPTTPASAAPASPRTTAGATSQAPAGAPPALAGLIPGAGDNNGQYPPHGDGHGHGQAHGHGHQDGGGGGGGGD